MKKLIIFGCGYVGKYLAELIDKEYDISKTHRNTAIIFNEGTSLSTEIFKNVTHILISIPPDSKGDLVLRKHLTDISNIKTLEWIGYLSSTGVYGDHQGEWVTEESELLADDPTNKGRIIAEQQWLDAFPNLIHIFRLAGIYGPTRSQLDAVKNGVAKRIYKEGQYFSRIHVEDITMILKISMEKPTPGEIYNLADDLPTPSHQVVEYYCDQLKLPYPKLINYQDAELSPMALSFYNNNKKVSNNKVKQILEYKFKYSSILESQKV